MSNLVDYHTHTWRCGHAEGEAEEYVLAALRAGLAEMGFSDHLFLYHLPHQERDPELGMAEEQLPGYVEEAQQLKGRYCDITLRLGVEADYIPGHEEKLASILAQHPWDYVIGSIHFIDGWGFDDPRYLAGYDNWDIDDLYRRYFELVISAAETGLFDVMGHLDLVKKFGHRPRSDMSALYGRLAEAMAASRVAIEVSTAGLRRPAGEVYPHPLLLRQCFLHGVPVTLGSDAHRPHEVAWEFGQALHLIAEAGYREIVAFDSKERIPLPLG